VSTPVPLTVTGFGSRITTLFFTLGSFPGWHIKAFPGAWGRTQGTIRPVHRVRKSSYGSSDLASLFVWSAFRNTPTAQRIGSREPFSSNEEYRIFRPGLANEYMSVTDLDCVGLSAPGAERGHSRWRLVGAECLWEVEQVKERIPRGATCVLIFQRPRRTL
jgi:hypothetical protein